ncbi:MULTISPECIES: MarR family transcriptional regulator [unclassified Allobranchiibius]|uniref:MarR family winged helix-turn-helix transcriptional regulator n=1 Tax=unclassified Allobranchiibius TaxID=2649857 RepID=UPI001AA1A911|nr:MULTISPECIES: MarR family transcriptional regulator [unclassified Allobranchiibius]MBO1767183.1 MarR family transcriptional regulator [Allobranchiibius sp. GilTou38]UIJ35812.1 MarR family transcriptional regulator [Allobranchiibius sp. GilTou73]
MTSGVRWLDDEEQRVWRQWLQTNSRLQAHLARQMQEESRLSLPDFEVLVTLSETPERRMRVVALADSIKWERSRLSHHLTRMEKRDLVTREECAQDRRGAFVALTPSGLTALEGAAPGHVREVRAAMFDVLSPQEIAQLDHITATLLARLGQEDEGGLCCGA